jgi:hypothetical protein
MYERNNTHINVGGCKYLSMYVCRVQCTYLYIVRMYVLYGNALLLQYWVCEVMYLCCTAMAMYVP